jgi:hypothetical protein
VRVKRPRVGGSGSPAVSPILFNRRFARRTGVSPLSGSVLFFPQPHASPWFPLALFETDFAIRDGCGKSDHACTYSCDSHAPKKFRARSEPSGRDYSVWPAEKRCIHSGNRALNRCLHVQAKIFRAVGTRSASKAARKSRRPRGPHAGSVACEPMPAKSAPVFSFVSFAFFVSKIDCSSLCEN